MSVRKGLASAQKMSHDKVKNRHRLVHHAREGDVGNVKNALTEGVSLGSIRASSYMHTVMACFHCKSCVS